MVTLKIPTNLGELGPNGDPVDLKYRQIGSLPLSFGLQKAFARYAALQASIFEEAKIADFDTDSVKEGKNKHERLVENVEKLSEEKTSLLMRAFGKQLTLDDLDLCSAEEVDIAFARLQIEAGGIVRKNS